MNGFANIKAIAKRELGGYFSSPVAYVFLVIFLLMTGFFTFSMEGNFFQLGQASLESFFKWHPWLYLFLVPCVGMRLWAEERRVGTLELLLTKPITVWQAIIGKFLASWLFLGLALLLTFPIFITVNYLGSPDNGVIFAAYLGSLLLAGTYLAISCMTSAMTRNQVVSFILSVVICLLLVLCGFPAVTSLLTRLDRPWIVDLVSSFSVMTHFEPFSKGMVDSRDIVFFLLVIGFALFTNGVIIRSHGAGYTSKDKIMKQKSFESILYSTAGVAAMFVVMLSFYIVASALKLHADVTADKAHTLSAGTRKILGRLDSRVTVRFYCTQADNAMPPILRTYGQHIEDLLSEYRQAAQGKILVQKLDPKPDSDVEDSARLNGITGQATAAFGSDKIYLGIVVSLLDQKFVLPWLPPERERLLEYDISRAISRVVDRSPPVVGIMSGLPVFGKPANPMMRQSEQRDSEAWAFVTELKKDFTIREVPMMTSRIDDQIKVLVVVHPRNISDTAQYAIDQFIMRGGKLLAFLDPHAYFDQVHDQENQKFRVMGDSYGQSSLERLLKAWGLTMDEDKVTADTSFASRNSQNGDIMPTLLAITRAGIDQNDVVTSQIDNLMMPFAGAFTGTPAEGLKESVLVRSSPNSMLIDSLISTAASEQILRDFKASKIQYPLAVHLTGKFKTAFPEGKPRVEGDRGDTKDPAQLKESNGTGEVVLVADTDMLNDKMSVKVDVVMGRRVSRPLNGNLNFMQSLVEQLSGDDDLIGSRSRASMNRPFTRVKDMQAKAGEQWEQKIQLLETQQRETERKMRELQTRKEGGGEQNLILSPEQQKERDNYQKTLVEVGRDLKQVRKNLRKDTDALEFWTKVINIAAMPVVVAFSGFGLAMVKLKRRAAK